MRRCREYGSIWTLYLTVITLVVCVSGRSHRLWEAARTMGETPSPWQHEFGPPSLEALHQSRAQRGDPCGCRQQNDAVLWQRGRGELRPHNHEHRKSASSASTASSASSASTVSSVSSASSVSLDSLHLTHYSPLLEIVLHNPVIAIARVTEKSRSLSKNEVLEFPLYFQYKDGCTWKDSNCCCRRWVNDVSCVDMVVCSLKTVW